MDFRLEFIKALKKNYAYDFIANHYWEMNKDTLKDICLELLYQVDESCMREELVETLEYLWLE